MIQLQCKVEEGGAFLLVQVEQFQDHFPLVFHSGSDVEALFIVEIRHETGKPAVQFQLCCPWRRVVLLNFICPGVWRQLAEMPQGHHGRGSAEFHPLLLWVDGQQVFKHHQFGVSPRMGERVDQLSPSGRFALVGDNFAQIQPSRFVRHVPLAAIIAAMGRHHSVNQQFTLRIVGILDYGAHI